MSARTLFLIILIPLLVFLRRLKKNAMPKVPYPVVGSVKDKDLGDAMIEGVKKYPDTPFVVPGRLPRVILPMSMFKEVMNYDTSYVSFRTEIFKIMNGHVTYLGDPHRLEVPRTVRAELTKAIPSLLPQIQTEIVDAYETEAGLNEEWHSVEIFSVALRIVARMSGRVFVGGPLNRDEEWLRAATTYSVDCSQLMLQSFALLFIFGAFLRALVLPFLPVTKRIKATQKKVHALVQPVVQEILAQSDEEKMEIKQPGQRGTFVSWLLRRLPNGLKDSEYVAMSQLIVNFASSHTMSNTFTQVLFDLATRPEYIDALRAEMREHLKQENLEIDDNGRLFASRKTFAKMSKMDSFIKESQRMNPFTFAGSARRVIKDTTFSNGVYIPEGTSIGFPGWAIQLSPNTTTNSADYNKGTGNAGPEEFDGFRFERLRAIEGRERRHQAVTTSEDQLNFGHGPNACAGRFFAVYSMKCMLIELLQKYDIRLVGDIERVGGENKLPKRITMGLANNLDSNARLDIRRRKEYAF